jgi:hypothetical protein
MRFDEHFLNHMRQIGDPDADNIVITAFKAGFEKQLYSYLSLQNHQVQSAPVDDSTRTFLLQPPIFPKWFSQDRFIRGQQFFRKYALDIMTLLGAMSLPYCYAASPGNKAIYLTEKMRKSPGKRLLETAHFIIEVLKEDAFGPSGVGAFEIQKTRLIHALVRYYIVNKTPWNPEWGMPVNQEDMAGTNLAFSYIIIKGMKQSDFSLAAADAEDFLYAWRFIGTQLRIHDDLLPDNLCEAEALEVAIRERHFRQSIEGPLLTDELIRHYKESFPAVASYFVDSQIRYFVGPEVSALLGLRPEPVKDLFVNWMNCLRKAINRNFINPFSYEIMMRNHLKLKQRYSA